MEVLQRRAVRSQIAWKVRVTAVRLVVAKMETGYDLAATTETGCDLATTEIDFDLVVVVADAAVLEGDGDHAWQTSRHHWTTSEPVQVVVVVVDVPERLVHWYQILPTVVVFVDIPSSFGILHEPYY